MWSGKLPGISLQQAHRGALVAGREKEGELATTSVEFEYLHRKSRCEMLIVEDDFNNDVITLGTYCSMFVDSRARFRFALIGVNLTAQSRRGATGKLEVDFKFQRRSCKLSFLSLPRRQSARESLLAGYRGICFSSCLGKLFCSILNQWLHEYIVSLSIIQRSQIGFLPNNRTQQTTSSLSDLDK